MYTEYKESESFENLSKIVTEEAIDPTITLKKPKLSMIRMMNFKLNSLCIAQLAINYIQFPICCR